MNTPKTTTNFIREIIDKDLETGKFTRRVHTRRASTGKHAKFGGFFAFNGETIDKGML